jgi:LCP family protein required for cell wall assembly
MPPPEKGPGEGEGEDNGTEQQPPSDETQEYSLGDDSPKDLDDEETAADDFEEEAADEELDRDDAGEDEAATADEQEEQEVEDPELAEEESELDEIISAQTEEWDAIDAAEEDSSEQTLVQRAGSAITSGFDAVSGEKVGSGFKAIKRRARFPIWARFLTATLVIVLSVGTATAASLLMYLDGIAEDLKLTPEFKGIEKDLSAVDGGGPQTILILGSDKRPEFKGDSFRGLSDTTMLLRVDPERNAIALFSLPRDLAVEIPGYGTAKLNEAYANGGPELTLKTIKLLTDVPASPGGLEVNHIVNVDFEGFARAVNAIDCVYVDVDRRYFHSNDETVEDYEEIDLQPGYQALCGFNALDYARYRHTDNDVVRAARQQEFLREARQKVPPEVVFADRKELIDIFTEHTTSDIDDAATMLQVLKLFIEARNAPVKEVHFEGTLGPSFVNTTPEEINKAVAQFLGIEDTPGALGKTAAPEDPGSIAPEAAPDDTGATPAASKAKKDKGGGGSGGGSSQLVESTFGKELAKNIRAREVKLPIYYPTVLEAGTDYAQKPRVYKINGTGDGAPPDSERAAYKWVFSRPTLGEYYGFMATRWQDPPILKNPSEEREIDGRDYKLFYDGDRLKLIAWQTDEGSFWVSNTLIQSLSDREMIDIAKGMTELPRRGGGD